MGSIMKKGEALVKEITARLKGDNDGALAAKIVRKAISAVESQIAALKAREVDLEGLLEDAKEAYKISRAPLEMITDNQSYIREIKKAKEAEEKAVEELQDVVDSIKYFEELLNNF